MGIDCLVTAGPISNRKTKGIALMLNNKANRIKIWLGVFFAIALASVGFYGCGTNSSSTLELAATGTLPGAVPITGLANDPSNPGQVTITAPNTLSNGNIVVIAGTTNYNGQYVVANATPPSFNIVAPYVGPIVPSNPAAPPVFQTQITSGTITAIANSSAGQVTITAPNTLTNGANIVISGSTNYNGTYTAINPTSTGFDIVATYVAPAAGATNGTFQIGGGLIPGCSSTSTGTAGAISLPTMVSATRYSGVAPLAVFFDATTATATATTRPFHDLEYRWNFGDDDTALWAYGSHVGDGSVLAKKNRATGPVAAHVFERPGTYIVNLKINDGTNTISNSCTQIAVQDPDIVFASTNTICIGATTDPVPGAGGCPAGAAHALQPNWSTVISTYALTGKRVLLNRGDTWTGSTVQPSILVAGPGIIGSFGTGAAPVIRTTSTVNNSTLVRFSGVALDWRVMDLDLDGQSDSHRNGVNLNGPASQITLLRLNMHHLGGGIEMQSGNGNLDQNAVVDSTIAHIDMQAGGGFEHGIGAYGSRQMVLGNSISDLVRASHPVRIHYADRGIFSSNTISGAADGTLEPTVETFTLRAPIYDNGIAVSYLKNAVTNKIMLSDNQFIASGYVAVGMSAFTTCDCRTQDVISERNWYSFPVGSGAGVAIAIENPVEVTIRNEIIDTTNNKNSANNLGIGVGTTAVWAGQAIPDNVRIYNNSIYNGSISTNFRGIKLEARVTNITVKNNVAYAPNSGTGQIMISGTGASGLVASNNSTDSTGTNQINLTNPGWTIASPMPLASFKPTSGYTIGGGATAPKVPVFSDFFLSATPATPNLGAVNP
jgi:hypothetical protein